MATQGRPHRPRSNQKMAVKSEKLETPERDLAIDNREMVAATPAEAQLAALRQRIQTGLSRVGTDPRPKGAPACHDCFQRGWIEALRALTANG